MKASFAEAGVSGVMGRDVNLSDAVPQTQPLSERQQRNAAGGYTFTLADFARLRRFLILGSEGGTYYVTEQKLTLESARVLRELVEGGRGEEAVAEIVRVSTEGRAPKQTPAIFALALACRLGDAKTKTAAYAALPQVARTASALFDFMTYSKAINQEVAKTEGRTVGNASWGRGMRHATANWYLLKDPRALAYQITKYGSRNGWSHRDLLRLSHPKAAYLRTSAALASMQAALSRLPADVAAGSEGDEEWTVVDALDDKKQQEAPSTDEATTAINQKVHDLQTIFQYVVSQEVPTVTAGSTALLEYLTDAHHLKKGRAVGLSDSGDSSEQAAQSDAQSHSQPETQSGRQPQTQTDLHSISAQQPSAASGDSTDSSSSSSSKPSSGKKRPRLEKRAAAPISVADACALIAKHRFSREHIGDTRLLKERRVWQALLDVGMPFTALTRNLGRLTALGMFDTCDSAAANLAAVTARFTDPASLKAAWAHPIVLLHAMRVYSQGHGNKGSGSWDENPQITEALEAGFYASFRNVQPTGKRFLVGIDVSGSMDWGSCAGMTCLTPRDAATAVAMCLKRTEDNVRTMAFSDELIELPLTKDDTLKEALKETSRARFGSTDCSLPMVHAISNGLKVDCFVVITDNETYFGKIHPSEAIKQYRTASGIEDARLLVLATSGTGTTIADPQDPLMLDIPGMDAGVPEIMRQFILGEL